MTHDGKVPSPPYREEAQSESEERAGDCGVGGRSLEHVHVHNHGRPGERGDGWLPRVFQQMAQLDQTVFGRAKARTVVVDAPSHHLSRALAIVDFRDFDATRTFVRQLLVAQEVMAEAVDHPLRSLRDVTQRTVSDIAFENRDDLVVGFVAVDHAQAADRQRANDEVTVRGRSLGENADVERVAVAATPFRPARDSHSAATEAP